MIIPAPGLRTEQAWEVKLIKDLRQLKGHEILMAFIIFFIAGICFGIAIGLKMSQVDQDDIRADIELIKSETELAQELDRVLVIYNEQLRQVMDNYQKALEILKRGGK